MKTVLKSSMYFSAYPLKVLEQVASKAHENHESPYLQSLLAGKAKYSQRLRVMPMAVPENHIIQPPEKRLTEIDSIEPQGGEWYNHYE